MSLWSEHVKDNLRGKKSGHAEFTLSVITIKIPAMWLACSLLPDFVPNPLFTFQITFFMKQ